MKMTPWILLNILFLAATNQQNVHTPLKAVSESPVYWKDNVTETESAEASDFAKKPSETLPLAPEMLITDHLTKEEKCKFPEYIQGSFINLHVDGGKFRYTVVEHENNRDVDDKVVENEKAKFVDVNHEKPTQQVKSKEDKIIRAGVSPFILFTYNKGQRDGTKPMGLWNEIKSMLGFEDDSTATSNSIPESTTQQPMTSTEIINHKKNEFEKRDTSTKLKQNKSEFLWNCTMSVEDSQYQEQGIKFLVWGGQVKNIKAGNATRGTESVSSVRLDDELNETMSYACLCIKTTVSDVMEYFIIGKGMPKKDQELKDFAQELCSKYKENTLDDHIRGVKNPIYVSKSLKNRQNEESSSKSPMKRSVDFGPTRCTPRRK